MALEVGGHHVVDATLDEAVRLAAAEHPELILLDLHDGDARGPAVAQRLKASRAGRPPPVIIAM